MGPIEVYRDGVGGFVKGLVVLVLSEEVEVVKEVDGVRVEDPQQSIEEEIYPDALQENKTWGFVVYRCSYNDDKAWNKMLKLIYRHAELRVDVEMDHYELWSRHKLIVMDDKAKFDGATTHDIRAHFSHCVKDELNKVRKPRSKRQKTAWKYLTGATRYNFCLLVDDTCLESLSYMPG
ncbi:hypothetical protein AJ80_01745 [Polytolypa hystricis UAMH7299]|uniref:Uncharacterized protein n=1 Tax=Polytolypa hystricis (strain UAMH7299) TaxID=1447883 RepID=A0A2B7YY61_POLH7|nr:hypothetical protein AJ80_01745 [Polytolypa hystricis UAMH7299]